MNQIILARIDKLKTNLKEIIKTASCIGNEIALDLLSYLFRNKYSDISAFLTDLEKEDIFILFSEMSYLFKYGVIRDVVYNIQLKKVLRELHGEIGEAIEKIHKKNIENYYSVLAYHYENAENAEKALFYHEKAGYQAKENYHNDQALYHFDRAAYFISVKNGIAENEWLREYSRLNLDEVRNYVEISFERFHFYFAIKKNIQTSTEIIDEVLKIVELSGDKRLLAMSMVEKSLIFVQSARYEQAIETSHNALEIFEELKMYHKVSLCHLNSGKAYFMTGKFDKALETYNKALEISFRITNEKEREKIRAKIYGDMGIANDYAGNFDKALDYYNKQLDLTEKLNLKMDKAGAIGNIGIIYHLTGNLRKAQEYYEQKLRLSEELGLRLDTAHILNNIGFLFKDLKNYKKSVAYHKKSISLSRELSDYNTMSSAYVNLGNAYRLLNDFQKSEQNFLKGIDLAEEYGFKHIIAEGMIDLADLYFSQEHFDLSKEYAEAGLKAAKEIGYSEYIEKGTGIFEKNNSK